MMDYRFVYFKTSLGGKKEKNEIDQKYDLRSLKKP